MAQRVYYFIRTLTKALTYIDCKKKKTVHAQGLIKVQSMSVLRSLNVTFAVEMGEMVYKIIIERDGFILDLCALARTIAYIV